MTAREPERLDLDDAAAVGGYDLEAMRTAVRSRTSGGDGGGGGASAAAVWGPVVVAAVVVVAIGSWLALPGSGPSPIAVRAVQAAPQTPLAPVRMAPAPVQATPLADPPAIPQAATSHAAPGTAAGPLRTAPVWPPPAGAVDAAEGPDPTPNPVLDPPTAGARPGEAESPEGGDLALQTEVFGRGQRALSAGRSVEAAGALQDYLERWPSGYYRDDALISVLDLAIRDQAWVEVESLAGQLASISALSPRRTEFLRARGEALVHLERCPEALEVADQLPRGDAVAIRKSCRYGIAR